MNLRNTKAVTVAMAVGSVLLVGLPSQLAASPNTTAQSIMVFNNDTNGQLELPASQFVLLGSETWSYDKDTAKTYFTNAWNGNAPTVSCTGPGCAPGNTTWIPNYCATLTAPPAPTPTATRLNPVVGQNSCTFFNGGTLSGDTYTDTASVNGTCNVCEPCNGGSGCGFTTTGCPNNSPSGQKYKLSSKNANFTYTYTYNITPTQATVDPRTAWNLDSSNNQPAHVEVSANVAGQSTLRKGTSDCSLITCSSGGWKFKASHTITDVSGLRVNGMKIGVYDANNMLVGTEKVQDTDFTLSLGTSDYFYAQNAGVFGDPNQLLNNALVSDIQQGDVAADPQACTPGLNRDDHCGNDTALGEKAVMNAPVSFDLSTEGNYTLRVSGNVKENAGTLNQAFAVCSSLTISAGSCSTAIDNCQ